MSKLTAKVAPSATPEPAKTEPVEPIQVELPPHVGEVPPEVLAKCANPEQRENVIEYFKKRASVYSLSQAAMPKFETLKELKIKLILWSIPFYVLSLTLIVIGVTMCSYGQFHQLQEEQNPSSKNKKPTQITSTASFDLYGSLKMGGSVSMLVNLKPTQFSNLVPQIMAE